MKFSTMKTDKIIFQIGKVFTYCVLIAFSVTFIIYLLLPAPELPPSPPNSIRSPQPADIAFPLRPAYFTNLNRQQIINYYENYFSQSRFKGIYLFTYRLNYPPEESGLLVRPHIQSSYLEEIIHPFRESIFINGFYPTDLQDKIWHEGEYFDGKVTVKYIPSSFLIRIILGISTLCVVFVITRELIRVIRV